MTTVTTASARRLTQSLDLELRAERDRLDATLPDRWSWRPLASAEITALADALGGLISIIQQSSPVDRAAVCKELRLRLGYHPEKRQGHSCR